MNMRVEVMSMTVTSRLQAMRGQLAALARCGSAVIRVPGALGLARVQDAHRDVLDIGRQNRARMQHLRAEVGQLGRLGERQAAERAAAVGDDRADRR